MNYGSDTPISTLAPFTETTRLSLSPNEQELMDLKQRISINLEEVRRSVGAVQLEYIESVQRDMSRAHELLHALIVNECKNKVNIYKRQINRLHKTLDEILGSDSVSEAAPTTASSQDLGFHPPAGTFQCTSDSVYYCAWSADGTKIASACGDKIIRVSDVPSGDLIRSLEGHKDDVFSVCFSADGTKVLSASKDKTVRLWDLLTSTCIMVFSGHTMAVMNAVFVDNNSFVSVSQDKTLRKWDIRTGQNTMVLNPDGHPLLCCAVSLDGRIVATSSSEGTLCFIDIRKGTLLRTIRGHKKAVWNVVFSPNGKMLSSCGEDSGVRVWDTETGGLIRSFGDSGLCTYASSFSRNMKMIASSSVNKTVRIWNLETGSLIRTITGHKSWIFHCAFSPDDRLLMTSSEDHTVRLWRVDTGEPYVSEMFDVDNSLRPWMDADDSLAKGRSSRSKRMSKSVQALFDDVRTNTCPEHCLALSFYCVEEKVFLCDECLKGHDGKHHIIDSLGLSIMCEGALQNVLSSFLHSTVGTDETLDNNISILMESRVSAKRKVEMTMNTLLEAIALRRKKLLKQVDVAYDQALLALRVQHDNYVRDSVARLNLFASEVNAGVLCDTYLSADSRFVDSKPPLVLQPAQICYFGSTTAQNVAAEIYRMGSVAINTAPVPVPAPGCNSNPPVVLQKPQAQMAYRSQLQQQQFSKQSKSSGLQPPVITMTSAPSNNVTAPPPNVQVSKLTPNTQEYALVRPQPTTESKPAGGSSPVARSSSEPLQPVPPVSLENTEQ